MVNAAIKQYRENGSADIRKVPTPTIVYKFDRGRIRDGIFTTGEWVDYVGMCSNGKPIAFDAKETRIRTRFDLKNVHEHQFDFLKSWHEKGAKAFLLICFIKHGYETYILRFEDLERFFKVAEAGGPKSIPYEYFQEQCEKVEASKGVRLHFLKGML